jgi:hypothetical protein
MIIETGPRYSAFIISPESGTENWTPDHSSYSYDGHAYAALQATYPRPRSCSARLVRSTDASCR